jgi:hypothetical protein
MDLATDTRHDLADFTTVLAAEPLPDLLVGVSHVLLLAFGIILLRGLHDSSAARRPLRFPDGVSRLGL